MANGESEIGLDPTLRQIFEEKVVERLLQMGFQEKFGKKIYELTKKYNLKSREVLAIFELEHLLNSPEAVLDEISSSDLPLIGYVLGDLFSTHGTGAPFLLEKEKTDGNPIVDYEPYCKFIMMTPTIPDLDVPDYGFIICRNRFFDGLRCGIINQDGGSFDEYCKPIPFADECLTRDRFMKVKKVSPDELLKEFGNYIKEKNQKYHDYGGKIYDEIIPIVEEIPEIAKKISETLESKKIKLRGPKKTQYVA